MKQHIAQDIAGTEYAAHIERVWAEWEPMLRTAERLLHAGPSAIDRDPEGGAQLLRRIQYRAHTSGAFIEAIAAPLAVADAHEYLVHTLGNVRETMGTLALRVEHDELDERSAELGLQHVMSTREAFHMARWSGNSGFAITDPFEPMLAAGGMTESSHGSRGGMLLWSLVAVCSALFVVLLVQVLLISSPT